MNEEIQHERQRDLIREPRAENEEKQTGYHREEEHEVFLSFQPRTDKRPDFIQNHRRTETHGADQRDLDILHEQRLRRKVNELIAQLRSLFRQQVDNRPRVVETDQ